VSPLLQAKALGPRELRVPLRRQGPTVDEGPEQIRVRIYSEEALAEHDEVGDVQHPIRVEVLQLHLPLVQ
jgi:hypothetical protein